MNVVLDTCALVALAAGNLSTAAVSEIRRADQASVSSVTAWEIAIKVALGKLDDRDGAVPRLPMILVERGMIALPIIPSHAIEAASLPPVHRDPFDRMLVAQGRRERLAIVTNDPAFGRYDVKTEW